MIARTPRMIRPNLKALLALSVSYAAQPQTWAQDATDADSQKAKEILEASATYLRSLGSFTVDAKSVLAITGELEGLGAQDIEQVSVYGVSYGGANDLAIKVSEATMSQNGDSRDTVADLPSLVIAGGKASLSLGELGVIQADEIATVAAGLKDERVGFSPMIAGNQFFSQAPAVSILNSLMVDLAGDTWDAGLSNFKYLGQDDTTQAHHISFEQAIGGVASVMELWIEGDDTPLPVQAKPDPRTAGMNVPDGLETSLIASWDNWVADAEIEDSAFDFEVAEGSDVYESLTALIESIQNSRQANANPADALVGKPAPSVELERLGGGDAFQLSALQGEKVVILDFWATWCGPCIRAMPDLMAIADEFADRDVVLIGVNQQEDTNTINRFLAQRQWELDVVLDPGSAARDYKVTGIPQTVIVGKDGAVAKVHIGYRPDLRDMLRSELNEILGE